MTASAGAKLAIADNNTTGHFMKQEFMLDVVAERQSRTNWSRKSSSGSTEGIGFIVADVEPEDAARHRRRD